MAEKNISPERIMKELAAIAFGSVMDCIVVQNGQVQLKEKLKPRQRAIIASVEKTSNGIKVKFYDKMKALELLGKHLGLFEGKDSGETGNENNLLEAIIQATCQEVDTRDISELQ